MYAGGIGKKRFFGEVANSRKKSFSEELSKAVMRPVWLDILVIQDKNTLTDMVRMTDTGLGVPRIKRPLLRDIRQDCGLIMKKDSEWGKHGGGGLHNVREMSSMMCYINKMLVSDTIYPLRSQVTAITLNYNFLKKNRM